MKDNTHSKDPLLPFLLLFYLVWSFWCVMLVRFPQELNDGSKRALARFLLWIVPTLAYVRFMHPGSMIDYLRLKGNIGKGLLWGAIATLLHPITEAVYRLNKGASFASPDWASWLNPILGAPIAEELLFRGVVLREFEKRYGRGIALVGSAVLFALIHLPYWWLSGQQSGWHLVAEEFEMFGYGLIFGILYLGSRSLWAPSIYHGANNFLTVCIRQI